MCTFLVVMDSLSAFIRLSHAWDAVHSGTNTTTTRIASVTAHFALFAEDTRVLLLLAGDSRVWGGGRGAWSLRMWRVRWDHIGISRSALLSVPLGISQGGKEGGRNWCRGDERKSTRSILMGQTTRPQAGLCWKSGRQKITSNVRLLLGSPPLGLTARSWAL